MLDIFDILNKKSNIHMRQFLTFKIITVCVFTKYRKGGLCDDTLKQNLIFCSKLSFA